MKRSTILAMLLIAASLVAGCAGGPEVRTVGYKRQQPTPVGSLLIVVDDTLFRQASRMRNGHDFASTLGATLRDASAPIPVTLLQIDSETDARALPRTIMSSHATQIMLVKATRVTTTNRGEAEAVWQLTLSDVNASYVPDERDHSRTNTRVEMRPFYREQISSVVRVGMDFLTEGMDKRAQDMGLAIAARMREDHVLTSAHPL
ncbi:hypothetical protein [Candidatus Burkholderia verschuerenii]|uniref:hypothetical protein n=1 Tax=Candidatus Burkholderia verschuerenii TaxID=242163 RepID=UPI00067E5013|nr:hypothetical protein [Candidatus Burkholderia verschuerenii]